MEQLRPDQTDARTLKDYHKRASIRTFTGREFYPFTPNARAVCAEDVAHALSMKVRWTGHVREFYSVAEHCYNVSLWLEKNYDDLRLASLGLLHDAAEAYLPDIASPVKGLVGVQRRHEWDSGDGRWYEPFRAAEHRLLDAILAAFGCVGPLPTEVSVADAVLYHTEAAALLPPVAWVETPLPPVSAPAIHCWPWYLAERRWTERFQELVSRGGMKPMPYVYV